MSAVQLAVVALVLTAAPVPPGAGRPVGFGLTIKSREYLPVLLLQSPVVRMDLRLIAEQVAEVEVLSEMLRREASLAGKRPEGEAAARRQELTEETDRAIARLLTPDRNARFRQLFWQVYEGIHRPVGLVTNPVAAPELGLNTEQKKTLAELQKKYRYSRMSGCELTTAKLRERRVEELKAFDAEVIGALTPAQRRKWNELQGPRFEGEIRLDYRRLRAPEWKR